MNGVNAHHLVVHVTLKASQTPEGSRLWPVACQPSKFHLGAAQRPFHGFHLHLYSVVRVEKGLLSYTVGLSRRAEQALFVQIPDLDVGVHNAVLTKVKRELGMGGVQRLV